MTNPTENTKRIAKNTLMLYVRMLFSMLVSLYTSRVVLAALGVEDYGIYNVVGGFVAMMGVVTSLLSQGTTRFITIAVGKGDIEQSQDTFSSLFTVHLLLGGLIIFVGEMLGPWAVAKFLTIPDERLHAAQVVFQFALLGFVINIVQVPYISSITAHEKMEVFALVGICTVVARLVIVFMLLAIDFDKLIVYSFLLFCVSVLSALFNHVYCRRRFLECKYKFCFNMSLYREVLTYTGWNAVGASAFTLNNQGVTILLNVFFGTKVNAARGIASSAVSIVNQFVSNFQQAVVPQIVKHYAAQEYNEMNLLITRSSQFSSYLVILFALPLFIETPYVLHLWLGTVPEYTVVFVRISLVQILVQSIDFPIGYGIHAVGRMKLPNLTAALIYLSVVPVSYFIMKAGGDPYVVYCLNMSAFVFALAVDIWILNKYTLIQISYFSKKAIGQPILLLALNSILPILCFHYMPQGLVRLIVECLFSSVTLGFMIFFFIFNNVERKELHDYICRKIKFSSLL